MNPDLREAARKLRIAAIEHDNAGHALREAAFEKWCADTVFPAAVNRWIREIGERP